MGSLKICHERSFVLVATFLAVLYRAVPCIFHQDNVFFGQGELYLGIFLDGGSDNAVVKGECIFYLDER